MEVEGCDISAVAVDCARRQADALGAVVRFSTCDALGSSLPEGYDVVTCSLFLHHLDDAAAITLLGRMAAAARRLVLVDDLIRSRKGFLLAYLGCRLLSRSPIVHYDGPVSVAGAFTPREALDLAACAGLRDATVTRHWPERYLLAGSVS